MSAFDRLRRGLVTLTLSPARSRPVALRLAPEPRPHMPTTLPAPVQPAVYVTEAEIDTELKELWYRFSPIGYIHDGDWPRFLMVLDANNAAYLRIIDNLRQSIVDAPLGREFRL